MLKVIIVLLIAGAVLYGFFGIWGIVVPVVGFVGIVLYAMKTSGGSAQPNTTNSGDKFTLSFDAEHDVANVLMAIKYNGSGGEVTNREVEIHKIGIAGNALYIRGFCRLAREERTFRVDRIIEATVNGKSVIPVAFVIELCKDREEFDKCALNGVSFCITGTLKIMTRRQAQERIEAYGGTFHKYIRYDTSFLVAENARRNTGKLIEARAHNIPIIDEDTFIDYLSDPVLAQTNKPPAKDQYEHYAESVEANIDHKIVEGMF